MIQIDTANRVVAELLSSAVTFVVHPDDREEIILLVSQVPVETKIEVTELQVPGRVTMFVGRNLPIMDLGVL